ncbi:MAG: copper resistance CopC family protein [Pseudomonadota bacterium]|jgi:methionine-rich copper-binding protein CopC
MKHLIKHLTTIALFALLLAVAPRLADAHAMLDRAEPRVGNTVASPPHAVTLWFTQKLETAFSTVSVTGPNGERVDAGKPQISGNQMSVALKASGKGVYRVTWRVLSVDSHTTEGNFTFTVGP